jgi:hypothetical protein
MAALFASVLLNRHGQEGVSYCSRRKVLKKHPHRIPYRVTSVREFKRPMSSVLDNADGYSGVLTSDGEDILDITFYTDETWIYIISGYVNSHNSRVWPATNSYEIKDTPFHDQKVCVGCHIRKSDNRPYFL